MKIENLTLFITVKPMLPACKPITTGFQILVGALFLTGGCTRQSDHPVDQEPKIASGLNYLLKPTNAIVTSSIKTISPVERTDSSLTEVSGLITYDTRRSTSIPIRFDGRIEKLFVRYNFQQIRKGQKILEIYSPELITAQRDLLYLLKSDGENSHLIDKAKERLKLFGLAESSIAELISTGKESYSFPVYSPVNGYVVEESASVADASLENSGASTNELEPTKNELLMREGAYVSSGQTILKVINTDRVWAEFDVRQGSAGVMKINDPITLLFGDAKEVNATVDFIQPFFKNGQNFMKVRVYLPNTENKYSIGQLVTATFVSLFQRGIWIPQSARLDLGGEEIAFIKHRGVFRPKSIVTSKRSAEWIEVVSGLNLTDSVASDAQFMVDSDSFIKVRN